MCRKCEEMSWFGKATPNQLVVSHPTIISARICTSSLVPIFFNVAREKRGKTCNVEKIGEPGDEAIVSAQYETIPLQFLGELNL